MRIYRPSKNVREIADVGARTLRKNKSEPAPIGITPIAHLDFFFAFSSVCNMGAVSSVKGSDFLMCGYRPHLFEDFQSV